MKIQKHKRNLLVGPKSKQDQANWEQNYDAIFARCPRCKRTRSEKAGCADAFHQSAG